MDNEKVKHDKNQQESNDVAQAIEASEANIKLQDAFYGDHNSLNNNAPVYVAGNNTPAINVNPKK
ncbi:hypothetical protein SAMN05192533_104146 [Mesobacillus persicus]|uniref:Uncharacterized protein n=1 Tax=Mesobacillus persicus TaxID=930146 RepID=A0A1H7ZZZ6_9BACI|nr:hypothetical protein [Mesobacillus persicus]SEM63274.1 hypothetical protein SAMN05192533_104146 [Mesobacillus persicus]